MSDTYTTVSDTGEAYWLMEKARIIESMEREMSVKERRELAKHWVEMGDQPELYLQIEVTDPDFYTSPDTGEWGGSKADSKELFSNGLLFGDS